MTPLLTIVFDRKCQASKDKEGVVELRITLDKQRKYISTGIKLLKKEWSNGSVIGRKDWKELNDQIQALKKKCAEIIAQMIDDGNLDINAIPAILKGRVVEKQTFIEYAKECFHMKARDLKKSTQKRYDVVFDFLERWKGIVYFADVTEQNVRKMDAYLADRGLKESSRYNYHKILKSFVLMAFNDGLIKRNPYAKVKPKRGDEGGLNRVLTPEEFKRLETSVMPLESLERIKDLFIFQTYTMMGYSDLVEFKYKNCAKVGGQVVYKAQRSKTGQEFTIVLLPPALRILKKYKNKLPIISNEKYNLYLKAVARFSKIDKPLTSHFARHTGATILLNDGNVPIHIIQHMLGHASIRETERTYAKLLDRSIVEAMTEYSKKRFG